MPNAAGGWAVAKRASYRAGVEWIACNDDIDLGEDTGYIISILLLADLFGKTPEQVAAAVIRYRKKEGIL